MQNRFSFVALSALVALTICPAKVGAQTYKIFEGTGGNLTSPDDYVRLGEAAARRGSWGEALTHFEKAVEMGGSAVAFYDLGVAYAHAGDLARAAEAERKAIASSSDYVPAYVELCWVLTQRGDLDGAEAAAKKALEIEPGNKAAVKNLAAIAAKRASAAPLGESLVTEASPAPAPAQAASPAKTADVLVKTADTQARAEEPAQNPAKPRETEVDAHLAASWKLFKQGDLEGARKEANEAIKIEPKNSLAHGDLGVILGSMGDVNGQINEEKLSIKLDQNNASAHANLAWAYAKKAQWRDAIASYDHAISLKPDLVDAQVGRGLALAHLSLVDDALDCLRAARDTHPTQALPRIGLGAVFASEGRIDEAMSELNEALKLEPVSLEAKQRLAALFLQKGEWSAAAGYYRQLIAQKPESADGHVGLGISLSGGGDGQAALESFKKAVEIDPGSAAAHAGLGLALAARGEREAALKEVNRALELEPGQELAQAVLKKVTAPADKQ